MSEAIVLFDGLCNLCDRAVGFLLRREHAGRFRFAALQSRIGQKLIARFDLVQDPGDTVLLIEDGRIYTRSTAALKIVRRLGGPWAVAYALIIIPRPIRDRAYDFIARRRYRWFGKRDSCIVPSEEQHTRFLE